VDAEAGSPAAGPPGSRAGAARAVGATGMVRSRSWHRVSPHCLQRGTAAALEAPQWRTEGKQSDAETAARLKGGT